MNDTNPRRFAWSVLRRIDEDDAYSHIALSSAIDEADLSNLDRGLATELVYGVLTWRRALDRLLDQALRKGVQSISPSLRELLRIATYQLVFLDRIPAHAAIDEAVEHARALGENTGLVNGVLRTLSRDTDHQWWRPHDREKKVARFIAERWSLPNWLGNRLQQTFGLERAEKVAAAFNERPPIWLRLTRTDGAGAAQRREKFDDDVRQQLDAGDAVVQDLGGQLVVGYCGARSGERVLDACAGLGGKSLQLAGLGVNVTAVDPQASKLELLREGAEKIGVADRINSIRSDLQNLDGTEQFDGVLVDAPCTGLGVLRRHPETRWRRSESDIGQLAKLQAELLDHAASRVRPGGWLTYSVCTWTREETSKQAERFLERHSDFCLEPIEGFDAYVDETGYLSVMPDSHDCDGFFAARFVRRKE